ncbi:MAG TPA: M67 family metallopeptidase [Nitrososphaera sp.]|jgi:[CysO sulfur-carrier protein]-S-L-cysteine hydrolase|nr:M67 family metallopeptidase [Nitrososphaera sp.]
MQVTTGIILTYEQIRQLANLAKQSFPNESCAFLLGNGENEVTVIEILPMRNADESMISFSIEPKELLQAYETAEKKKLQIVGIFHSHPARPSPSSTDKKFMEINPVVWLIYSTTNEQFKAYVYDDSVREVDVKITE